MLGLNDSAEGDWGRLRGLQYSGLARLTRPRLAAHGLAALLVVQALAGAVHLAILLAWVGLLGGVLVWGARFEQTLEDADRRDRKSVV